MDQNAVRLVQTHPLMRHVYVTSQSEIEIQTRQNYLAPERNIDDYTTRHRQDCRLHRLFRGPELCALCAITRSRRIDEDAGKRYGYGRRFYEITLCQLLRRLYSVAHADCILLVDLRDYPRSRSLKLPFALT